MKVSILTPTKNRREFLKRNIEHVRSQSYSNWQHIIFNNGDEPVIDLIPDDPRYVYVEGSARGPAHAFNVCLRAATGDIIHPYSDDDILPSDALLWATAAFKLYPDTDWLVGRTTIEDPQGRVLTGRGEIFSEARMREYFVLGGAVYWRKAFSDRVGEFDEEFDGAADYDLYWRFGREGVCRYVPHLMYRYVDHPQADTNVRQEHQRALDVRIKEKFASGA